MKIKPLTTSHDKPVAIVSPGKRSVTIYSAEGRHDYHGGRNVELAFVKYAGHVLYCSDNLAQLRHTTTARSWLCKTWRGREVRMLHVPSGASFVSLRGTLDYAEDPFAELQTALAWLRGYGVSPASIPSMAWQLWRSTLDKEIVMSFDDEIGKRAFYGGRQQIGKPRVYTDQVAYDIRAAYPVAMASKPYALSLEEVNPVSTINPDYPGIAMAEVDVPEDLPHAPLPVRIQEGQISFQRGFIRGTWSWCELAAAIELGCQVKVHRSFAPRREVDLFGKWWPRVAEGRDLPNGSGLLAKAISTSTWGQFGMVGTERGTRRWVDDSGRRSLDIPEADRSLPHQWTAHIAAETTARVRVRLLREGLYSNDCEPCHVDTDGIIVSKGTPLPSPGGSGPGDWRKKETMGEVDVRGPQLYRWTCEGCTDGSHAAWHYNASGIPAEEAPAFFARQNTLVVPVRHQMGFDRPLAWVADTARRMQVSGS